jgi:ferredoxin
MKIAGLSLVYYSPTGTSKKTLEGIAEGLGIKKVRRIDLTPPGAETEVHTIPQGELVVFAVPVYGGRIPPTATRRLRNVRGSGSPAVVVAVYGNRAFEDALVELSDITREQGFRTVAGAAFVGEHSFSTKDTPIAAGRPDTTDMKKAREFGEKVRAKLASAAPSEVMVPGKRPYKDLSGLVLAQKAPLTRAELCTFCGECAKVCPSGAVIVSDKVETDPAMCTACSACVKGCPTAARYWTHEGLLKAAAWLNKEFSARREPEFFL